ncbi:MAG: aminoacyl-tRNA hydrolase [Deltaproteobacteria bacterium CG12_big_fil_rev_8_21_14_0_65_43_10]|nr:MAG: aminoacyl-tRNA hydrolase [Deltaproteobacteria bacterium CG12_big_fil_rev_8_21_14_0_65_43_10]PIU85661.1 MAG: aminoacyl-tRNA hydrolase [Deltaproteobacteria bacterium CG06_land_8_20_14_3_00_44_19]PIX22251.1 MAG: aminoacyl-tRNA hydrolase [Deltaproteobacteria bacterium CG_4_8_14_3_um_filter_43_13]PIZ21117.1 MAG: aminoacyl-tRNA hydrolase [Deltaproteobacteria bacterium CG_4_10_14_0_8_um_filter_43_12]PJB40140.1 MAG: aminoacyl-tRNA hydrolase [Deltaproteobacteria bacterium CG_4_9_14_3_um_filter_4
MIKVFLVKLVVGLGNPGEYYKLTRHNIGFLVVERLAQENNIEFSQRKFNSIIGKGFIIGQRVILAKPLTYMNLCGETVKKLLDYFGIDPEALIVVHDDLDMEFGKIKIKEKGGHGGHNGVRSIISILGTNSFLRLKLGIGRPTTNKTAKDYVLGSFEQEQLDFLPELVHLGEKALASIITQGAQMAINAFNRQSCMTVKD